jgi:glycerol-1-phosphate dehydrogenase [NAD(P)+]
MYAVPTSLSNDGFCSPQSSLTLRGARRSLPVALPFAVVVDTEVCRGAPSVLWWSGVGDLVAKVTAVRDWKLAYHAVGEPVDDFAALLSDATVAQFLARPKRDLEGLRLLATALMLNGISMAVSGSSRPASGSEHLISHALDALASGPASRPAGWDGHLPGEPAPGGGHGAHRQGLRPHRVLGGHTPGPLQPGRVAGGGAQGPVREPQRYTVLSTRDCVGEVAAIIDGDPRMEGCFLS